MPPVSDAGAAGVGWYRVVWRWHFYAGLLCIPVVIWLALTGALYLWRPQLEGWLDRRDDRLVVAGPAAPADAQVAAALAAVPGARLHKYVLPARPGAAVRVLVTARGEDRRVVLDPHSLAVLGVAREERRPFRLLFHLHGELLAGTIGSLVVETAACWAIVMLATGLYLWLPRGRWRIAGVLWPRWRARGRLFWRDLHAVAGLWVSLFALLLIVTGLPWAKAWGSYLTEVRAITGTAAGPVDWTIGGRSPAADPLLGAHAGHAAMSMDAPPIRPGELARVVAAARRLRVAPPVLILPPAHAGAPWSIASDAADRPERSDAQVDGATGRIVSVTGFARRHWVDRTIGYGIALHEGALFGLANQLAGTATALLLVLLAVSGAVMWWRRRPSGLLGAPVPARRPRMGAALVVPIVALGVLLPMFGVTLLAVLLAERLVLGRLPGAARWLGLARDRPVARAA